MYRVAVIFAVFVAVAQAFVAPANHGECLVGCWIGRFECVWWVGRWMDWLELTGSMTTVFSRHGAGPAQSKDPGANLKGWSRSPCGKTDFFSL